MLVLPQNPIFVVGPPRSGTTYLQSLLACQNGVFSFPETHFFSSLRWLGLGRELTTELSTDDRAALIAEVCKRSGMERIADTLLTETSPKDIFEVIVREQLQRRPDLPLGDNWRWVEKTPGHVFHLDAIAELYPEVRFLGIYRAPIESVISRKVKVPADQPKSVRRLTLSWIQAIKAMKRFADQHPDRMRLIKYETLARAPEATMADACDFLGITFREENLARLDHEMASLARSHEVWKESSPSGVQPDGLLQYGRIFMWRWVIRYTLATAALRGELGGGAQR
jgi:hypothetical protein